MKKFLPIGFLIAVVIGGFASVGSVPFGTAQSMTSVSGIIISDTIWTNVNSPYNLTANVLVNSGVTLTIQQGVTVNLNGYYIMVNGTLTAKGNSNEKIQFNSGLITFTQYSSGWNQETKSGSIIQNAVISGLFNQGGAIYIDGGSPAILNNNMNVTISISGGSPIISGNTLTGVQYATFSGGSRFTSVGIAISYGSSSSGTAIITDNILSGGFDDACISIGGGSPIIQRNLLSDGYHGIDINVESSSHPIIENNTITSCYSGITVGPETAVIFNNNNVEDISNFSISLHSTNNLNVTNNWWGTTNTSEIDRKIWDFNDDYNLGEVNYNPFLTEPNPQAIPDPNAPVPTPLPTSTPTQSSSPSPSPSPTQNPTASPSQTGNQGVPLAEFYIVVAVLAAVIITLAVAVAVLQRRARKG